MSPIRTDLDLDPPGICFRILLFIIGPTQTFHLLFSDYFFLAMIGAHGVTMCVCLFVRSFVRSVQACLELLIFIIFGSNLQAISQESVSSQ